MSKSQKGNSPNSHKKKEENSKKLLNRKTKRDNNNTNNPSLEEIRQKIYLPNEIRCSICLEYEKFSSKCYKCIKCSSYFHSDCYNFFTFTEDNSDEINTNNLNNFKCIRCKDEEEKNNKRIDCYLCTEHDGIIKKLNGNDNYVHHYCYVYFNLNNAIKYGKCKLCKKTKIPTNRMQRLFFSMSYKMRNRKWLNIFFAFF